MEASGQLHAPGKKPLAPIGYESGNSEVIKYWGKYSMKSQQAYHICRI
jgi:hypothetical protein